MEHKDYYKILGIKHFTSQDDLKRAYRKLAHKFHPDVSKERDADEKFKELNEAYEVIRDPEKREAHDLNNPNGQTGPDDFQPPSDWERSFGYQNRNYKQDNTQVNTVGLSSFFKGVFDGDSSSDSENNGEQGFSKNGENVHSRVLIDLEDSINGATRSLDIKTTDIDSQGRDVNNQRTLTITIPKGTRQGQTIRLAEQGKPGIGSGSAGDLLLQVDFREHKLYRLVGQDIYLDLPITPWEVALGATIQIPTPSGNVDIKIPEDSQHGQKLRLNGRGLPGDNPGDFYVTLEIVLPPAIDPKARALYEQIRDQLNFNPRSDLF
ncbi:MAG: DnaJ C-terminal domain-containing protein [Methylococcales bacterium]